VQQVTLTQLGISKRNNLKDVADQQVEEVNTSTALEIYEVNSQKGSEETEENNDEDIQSEYVREEACTDVINRINRNGSAESLNRENDAGFSLWDSIIEMTQDVEAGRGEEQSEIAAAGSKWDNLFATKQEVSEEGLDDLLNLFEEENTHIAQSQSSLSIFGKTSISMLSQGTRAVAEEIITGVENSDLLDRSCPNWKENVTFALYQDDPEDVQRALENVQESRRRMLSMRQKIMDAWECQNAALAVFETALVASAARFTSESFSSVQEEGVGGFLTQDC
jgi:hypothetical protein